MRPLLRLILRALLSAILIAALLLCAWVGWDNWARFIFAPTPPTHSLDKPAESTTLARGEYLAQIGGCVTCHTSKGGETLAGSKRIDTPFGAVYSSNLTPSTQYGLGQWTLADFENALKWGRSRDGHLLLPAFPYNHTGVFTSEDVQAIFAWLQTRKPIDVPQPANRLTWPLGTQPVIAVWRSLFFTPTSFKSDPKESVNWNRGAYLVQSAGHCAACHGQRNSLGSFPAVDDISGGFLSPQMWIAPSLIDSTQTTLTESSPEEIAKLLRIGKNASAQVSGPMTEFVQHSGQFLTESDALAIGSYLKSRVQSLQTNQSFKASATATSSASAQEIYKTHCAACHGDNGQGKPNAYPALAHNPAVVLDQPENLIQIALYGGYGPSTTERPRPTGMPPYLFTLSNEQIADVLNHVRSQWGNKAPAVTPLQVDRVRSASY